MAGIARQLENSIKYVMLFVACIVFRFAQVIPNVEPVMFTTLPVAKKFGGKEGFVFAFLAVAIFDFVTNKLGIWTLYTALAYGAVGFLAAGYLARKEASRWNFLKFSVAGTLAYDLVTSLIFGWQFGQTLEATLIGQIPFTLYHLLGNILLVGILSPFVYENILKNEALALSKVIGR